mgnify:CR=1 FL=1
MSQYGSTTLSSLTFTVSSGTVGLVNGVISLEVLLLDINSDPVEGAPIYFHWVSGDYHGHDADIFFYDNGESNYATTGANGKATGQIKVVNVGSTLINATVNNPSELTSLTSSLTINDEETEVYVTGFEYQGSPWMTDIEATLYLLDDAMRDIVGLDFWDLALNHSEAIDANQQTRTAAILFMKRVTYNNIAYLSSADSSALRTAIITKLNSISDISFDDVEVRSSKKVSP